MAKTLGTEISELDRVDGNVDGKISILALEQSPKFKDRIVHSNWQGVCENAFVVDNGDGKIGKGDLFLRLFRKT